MVVVSISKTVFIDYIFFDLNIEVGTIDTSQTPFQPVVFCFLSHGRELLLIVKGEGKQITEDTENHSRQFVLNKYERFASVSTCF